MNFNSPVPFLLADRQTVAVCDPDDFHRVSQFHWRLQPRKGRTGMAYRLDCGKRIFLHRFILPVEGNINFKDGNSLNVTKRNLIVRKDSKP